MALRNVNCLQTTHGEIHCLRFHRDFKGLKHYSPSMCKFLSVRSVRLTGQPSRQRAMTPGKTEQMGIQPEDHLLKVAVLGAGNMGGALLQGWLDAGTVTADRAAVSARQHLSRERWEAKGIRTFGDILANGAEGDALCDWADVIVLGVKPSSLPPILERLRTRVTSRHTVISLAAGWTTTQLSSCLTAPTPPPDEDAEAGSSRDGRGVGSKMPLVLRVMPNTPIVVGEGACGFCFAPASPRGAEDGLCPEGQRDRARALMQGSGVAVEVEEALIDAVVGVSGSSPAYFFLVLDAMADGGVRAGLPRAQSLALAAQTMKGAAEMVLRGEGASAGSAAAGGLGHPGVLRDQVTSPGGPTIAAMAVLEERATRAAFAGAVVAAAERSKAMSAER